MRRFKDSHHSHSGPTPLEGQEQMLNLGGITLAGLVIGVALFTHTLPLLALLGVAMGILQLAGLLKLLGRNKKADNIAQPISNMAATRRNWINIWMRL